MKRRGAVTPAAVALLVFNLFGGGLAVTANAAAYGGGNKAAEAARDPRRLLVKVALRRDSDRQAIARVGTLVEEYGPFAVVAADPLALDAVRRTPEGADLDIDVLDTTISLRQFRFEPLRD